MVFTLTKWSIKAGTSLDRALRLGTSIGKTFNLNNKSSRKIFSLVSTSKSLCVAQMMRTSNLISFVLPTLDIVEFSNTRSNFVCRAGGMSPISSKNRVPLCACSNLPRVVLIAPVNAPFSKPNISASMSSLGIAAQFNAIKSPLRRLSS